MPSYQPYQNNYYSKKRKIQILIAVLTISILAVLLLLLNNSGKKSEQVENTTIGQTRDIPSTRPVSEEENQPESGANRSRSLSDLTTDTDPKPKTDGFSTDSDSSQKEPPVNGPTTDREELQSEESGDDWVSDVDAIREQGLLDFDQDIQQCWDKREQIAQLLAEYDANCTGTSFDAYGNPIVNATTPQCRKLQALINQLRSQLARELEQARNKARKAGLYPGQIRDILEKFNFQE
jgi:hypothetical protein